MIDRRVLVQIRREVLLENYSSCDYPMSSAIKDINNGTLTIRRIRDLADIVEGYITYMAEKEEEKIRENI